MVLLVLIATLPWKLVNDSDRERARLNGERAYILNESAAGLLIYRAETGSAIHYPQENVMGLERQGIDGYLFEEPEAFASAEPGCSSITQNLNGATN